MSINKETQHAVRAVREKIKNKFFDDSKVQVGYHKYEQKRKIGERWTDSDGKEWIQHKGYRKSVSKLPDVGIFRYQCKECKKNCVERRDIDTFKRMDRCFVCQINFEVFLKSRRIGEKGNKW